MDPTQTKAHVSQLGYKIDHCKKCNEPVQFVEFVAPAIADGYKPRECVLIRCENRRCRHRWLYCTTCNKIVHATNLKSHPSSHNRDEDQMTVDPPRRTEEQPQILPEQTEVESASEMETETTYESHFEEGFEPPSTLETQESLPDEGMPQMRMDGNEWLAEAMSHRGRCTINDLKVALAEPSLCRVKEFFLEELGSGEGRCGGGLCHIVARAFQQKNNERLDRERIPGFQEAKWHLDNLALHQSMNDKQRKRQAELNQKLSGSSYAGEDSNNNSPPLVETFVPRPNQMGRYYGGSRQRHSMLELLPVPKAKDVEGVAYVGPTAVLKHAFANGIPVDDIVVLRPTMEELEQPAKDRLVLHVQESRRAREWLNRVKRQHYGKPDVEDEKAIGVILMDWKDGFAYSFVKSNRGSVDVKTMNVSPPKTMTNE